MATLMPIGAHGRLGRLLSASGRRGPAGGAGARADAGRRRPLAAEGRRWAEVVVSGGRRRHAVRVRLDGGAWYPTRQRGPTRGARPEPGDRPHGIRVDGRRGWGPLDASVIYELHRDVHARGHVRGGARAARRPADLGVTAIELMPVAEFPGRADWGYDGVLSSRRPRPRPARRPAAPRRRAHAPGSRSSSTSSTTTSARTATTSRYTRRILHRRHDPWGAALNFDGPSRAPCASSSSTTRSTGSRSSTSDGLRLDATHAIPTTPADWLERDRAPHPRDRRARRPSGAGERRNDGASGRPAARRGLDAQWNDDLHHAFTCRGRRAEGYYADYRRRPGGSPIALPAEGFALQGDPASTAVVAARRARRAAERLRQLPAQPRPDRQPRLRRAAGRAGRRGADAAGGGDDAARARALHALHGRDARRDHAVPLLRRLVGRPAARSDRGAAARRSRTFPAFADPATRDTIPVLRPATFARKHPLDWDAARRRARAAGSRSTASCWRCGAPRCGRCCRGCTPRPARGAAPRRGRARAALSLVPRARGRGRRTGAVRQRRRTPSCAGFSRRRAGGERGGHPPARRC